MGNRQPCLFSLRAGRYRGTMRTIAIVGGGPRAISVVERLGSFLRDSADQASADDKSPHSAGNVAIHLIDAV